MRTYVIADTHFWDSQIIELAGRPFSSVEEMNEILIRNINMVVRKCDLLVHLGDVSFSGSERTHEILNRIHGTKLLVKGNHDLRTPSRIWETIGFETALRGPIRVQGLILSHEPEKQIGQAINLHGHVHKNRPFHYGKRLNFCVEAIDYIPVQLYRIDGRIILNKFEKIRIKRKEYARKQKESNK